MSRALEGTHYCAEHQGNHSLYARYNCTVCALEAERAELRRQLDEERRQHSLTHACLIEARQQLERSNVGIGEVEAKALEHAALEFRAPHWVRDYLCNLAAKKRLDAKS